SSHLFTMPWYARISPRAYSSTAPYFGSGSGALSLMIVVGLHVEHLVLDRFNVSKRAAHRPPDEGAEGGEPHEQRDDELAQGQVLEHPGSPYSWIPGSYTRGLRSLTRATPVDSPAGSSASRGCSAR